MGKCAYYDVRKECKKKICCFECGGKCINESDMCYDKELHRSFKLKGYPQRCRLYIKEN